MSAKMKANASLMFVTISWGISFILAKNAIAAFPVFQYLGLRFAIAFVLSAVVFYSALKRLNRYTFKKGLGLGAILFAGFAIQTLGLNYTSASKSAFITGLSVILVPLLIAAEQHRIPAGKTLASAAVAVIGLGMIALSGGHSGSAHAVAGALSINIGDVLSLFGAIFFALHIVGVGRATDTRLDPNNDKVDPIGLAVLQIGAVAVLSILMSLVMETQVLPQDYSLFGVWGQLIFLSIFCTTIAFAVQNVAQQHTTAELTALIYAMEPVFAAFFGWMLLGEVLGPVGIGGALLIITGTLMNELTFLNSPKNPVKESC